MKNSFLLRRKELWKSTYFKCNVNIPSNITNNQPFFSRIGGRMLSEFRLCFRGGVNMFNFLFLNQETQKWVSYFWIIFGTFIDVKGETVATFMADNIPTFLLVRCLANLSFPNKSKKFNILTLLWREWHFMLPISVLA